MAILMVIASAFAAALLPDNHATPRATPHRRIGLLVICCVLLLLFCTATRSFLAAWITAWWASESVAMPGLLVCSAATGKLLGGVLADRFGWQKAGSAAMLALVILWPFAMQRATNGPSAMLLVQMAMAPALAALYLAAPRWPATVFGASSVALLIGAVPDIANYSFWYPAAWMRRCASPRPRHFSSA